MSKHVAVIPLNQVSADFPASYPLGKTVMRKVRAAVKRRGLDQFAIYKPKRKDRYEILWRKVRSGRITDARTLAAMQQDADLMAAFQRFDAQTKQFARQ